MLHFFKKNAFAILFFSLFLVGCLCFSNTSLADNTHESILGQSLNSTYQLVRVPPKNTGNKQDTKSSSRPSKGSSGASVQANQLKIDSRNTITGSVDSKHGAKINIGNADISNVQLDSATIDMGNTVHGRVKAQGGEARYRMGTVDIEGIRGNNLGISTKNTVRGDVSVKNGQDVAIGVIEMGSPKAGFKKDTPPSRHRTENNVVDFKEIVQFGHAVTDPWQEIIAENGGEQNEVCENEPVCVGSNSIEDCYNINGCSAVANELGKAKFGEDRGKIREGGRYIACNSHDQCYQTCGTDKAACDIQFYYDLVDECWKVHANTNKDKILTINQLENRGEAAIRGKKEIINDATEAAATAVVVTTVTTVGSGGAGFPAAIGAGLSAGAKDLAKNVINGLITDEDYRYTVRQAVIAAPNLYEGQLESTIVSLHSINKKNKEDKWINEWEKKTDANAKHAKTIINKSADKVKASIYDVGSSAETWGTVFKSQLNERAQNIAPKESFMGSLPENSENTCDANKGFLRFIQAMRCELVSIPANVYTGSEMVLSAASWGSKKAGSYLLDSSGQVADYAGSIVAKDIRFWGNLGVSTMQYMGHKSIDFSNSSTKFSVNAVDDFVEGYTDFLIFRNEIKAQAIQQVRSLFYDCLLTAENYYVGVHAMGEDSFRGNDREICQNNVIDDKCCIKNTAYNYHKSEQSPGQLTSYLSIQKVQSPLEKCLTQE